MFHSFSNMTQNKGKITLKVRDEKKTNIHETLFGTKSLCILATLTKNSYQVFSKLLEVKNSKKKKDVNMAN